MAAGDNNTEKLLEEYKKEQAECRQDLKEDERAEYDSRTAEEKTEWLRYYATRARAAACGLPGAEAEWRAKCSLSTAVVCGTVSPFRSRQVQGCFY